MRILLSAKSVNFMHFGRHFSKQTSCCQAQIQIVEAWWQSSLQTADWDCLEGGELQGRIAVPFGNLYNNLSGIGSMQNMVLLIYKKPIVLQFWDLFVRQ